MDFRYVSYGLATIATMMAIGSIVLNLQEPSAVHIVAFPVLAMVNMWALLTVLGME